MPLMPKAVSSVKLAVISMANDHFTSIIDLQWNTLHGLVIIEPIIFPLAVGKTDRRL